MAVLLAALLVPLNFIVFAAMRERGLTIAGVAPRFGLLFLESVAFAVLCRPENSPAKFTIILPKLSAIPLWILVGFVLAIAFFGSRVFIRPASRSNPDSSGPWPPFFYGSNSPRVGKMSDCLRRDFGAHPRRHR